MSFGAFHPLRTSYVGVADGRLIRQRHQFFGLRFDRTVLSGNVIGFASNQTVEIAQPIVMTSSNVDAAMADSTVSRS